MGYFNKFPMLFSPSGGGEFKFTVDTTKAGSASDTFILPCGNLGVYSATIDWGDGGGTSDITTYNDADLSHTYSVGGVYQITVTGDLPYVRFAGVGDRLKITSIDQWGSNEILSMDVGYRGCENLTANYSDTPTLGSCTTMYRAFFDAFLFDGDLGSDTASVTTFEEMLMNAAAYNQDITFDCTSCTTLKAFIYNADAYNSTMTFTNCDILESVANMCQNTAVFNKEVFFDTMISLLTAKDMFRSAALYNKQVVWTDSTSLLDVSTMFFATAAFNSLVDIETSAVTTFNLMFQGAAVYNQADTFDTSSMLTMVSMYKSAPNWNQDVSHYDVTSLTDATTFASGTAFGQTNYELLLDSYSAQAVLAGVPFHAGTATYTIATHQVEKDILAVTNTWGITDGGGV